MQGPTTEIHPSMSYRCRARLFSFPNKRVLVSQPNFICMPLPHFRSVTDRCAMAALDLAKLKPPQRGLFQYVKVHTVRTIMADTDKYLVSSPGLTVGEDGTQVVKRLLLTTFGRLVLVSPGKYEGSLTYTVGHFPLFPLLRIAPSWRTTAPTCSAHSGRDRGLSKNRSLLARLPRTSRGTRTDRWDMATSR